MPLPELRFRVTPAIMAKLDALQQYWGHRARAGAIEAAILEAHDRHLPQTRWEHQKAHAYRVLRRAKPGLIFEADEVSDVNFTDDGEWVVVTVGKNSAYKFSKKVWEQ